PTKISTLSLHDALPISAYGENPRRRSANRLHPALGQNCCTASGPTSTEFPDLLERPSPSESRETRSIAGLAQSSRSGCAVPTRRSEEHTSELQSLAYLV